MKKQFSKNFTVVMSLLIVSLLNTAIIVINNLYFISPKTKTIIIIILSLLNFFIGYIPLINFFNTGGRSWIIKQFTPIIFNAFFYQRINDLKIKNEINYLENSVYRVSVYKYYKNRSLALRLIALKRYILKSKYKNRTISSKKDCLLCVYRYGLEDGKIVTHPTTKPYIIEENNESDQRELDRVFGVAGMAFCAKNSTYLCLDNHNVNTIINKIKATGYIALEQKGFEQKSISENVCKMDDVITKTNIISNEEKDILLQFMEQTHTNYNDIFNISNGTHSNHFLGFKIYDDLHNPTHVVVIDARENDDAITFNDIINHKDDEPNDWMNFILNTLSGLTSKTISTLLEERKDTHGKRIRD